MNLQQFSKLDVGDEVQNTMSDSVGKVTAVDRHGVHVAWGGNARTFHYTASGTAWFHWEQISGCREPGPVTGGGSGQHM